MNISDKMAALERYLEPLVEKGICIAFSGGVDSAVLVAMAARVSQAAGRRASAKPKDVHAVTVKTPFHPLAEPEEARRLAEELGAVHWIVAFGQLPDSLRDNPLDRCYICKKWLFTSALEYASGNGLGAVADGTNADDLGQYRPGIRALRELGVRSPLAELGITKAQVRAIAAELGVSVAQKPSAPCLATRFPYGTALPMEKLPDIEELEALIRSFGCVNVRVRVYGDTLRIEVDTAAFPILLERRKQVISRAHQAGFLYVTLDLEGFRSGSMDLPRGEMAGGSSGERAAK